VVML